MPIIHLISPCTQSVVARFSAKVVTYSYLAQTNCIQETLHTAAQCYYTYKTIISEWKY